MLTSFLRSDLIFGSGFELEISKLYLKKYKYSLGAKTVTQITNCREDNMCKIVLSIEKVRSVVTIGSAVFEIRAETCVSAAKGENL